MRFLRHSARGSVPYVLHPPYEQARAELLARRPVGRQGENATGTRRLFGVVVDLALDDYLVSVYVFADGTISIYSSAGIHSTGLRGAPSVAKAGAELLDEVERALAGFSAIDAATRLPLPDHGHAQVLARTYDGDFVATDRLSTGHGPVARIAEGAFRLTELERMALVEGFDRVEAEDFLYRQAPEYRRLRASLLDWLPAPSAIDPDARVAAVAVEYGGREAVTTLFAFADGSTSLFSSDGGLSRGLSAVPGMAAAARALLEGVEAALSAFASAQIVTLPQPGQVHFVVRARLADEGEWTELLAAAPRAELEAGTHPLSAAFDRANDVLRVAG